MSEILNFRDRVYVSMATEKGEVYLLFFENEKMASDFTSTSMMVLKEVESKGHHNTSKKVRLFSDKKQKLVNFSYGQENFIFKLTTEEDTENFCKDFSKKIWGDLAG